ncbi:MAG: DNA repair protein RecN [Candidatus Latescibacteria bacterium]|nr:DNA repair protein RecN [Candidatus Latescibacterota bacterium]
MLSRLHVINYALIDDVEAELGPGLNIITGETGAGKSILIGALGLVLGMRASPDVIRTGEKRCTVEAVFELDEAHPCLVHLSDMKIDVDDGELIIRREVLSEGRSRSYANGTAIPARSLQTLGKALVDLHGQHEHQSLLDVGRHIDFLDGFGELGDLREEATEAFRRMASLQKRLAEAEAERERLRDRRELLGFQVEEINAASPEAEEDEQLAHEQSVLTHAERLIESTVELENLLYQGEDSVQDRLASAARLLEEAAGMDASLASRAGELDGLRYAVEELARFFGDYAQRVEYSPDRLEEVTERLELLGRLKKKYGASLEEVLAYCEKASAELARSNEVEASLNDISTDLEAARKDVSDLCGRLSEAREEAACRLAAGIQEALSGLGMPGVRFEVRLNRTEGADGPVTWQGRRYQASEHGIELAEFHISTNPGEAIRPLVRVASGGEISRIMLAMKSVLARTASVQVLIFDEIDIGISGRIAEVVGRKLKDLSQTYQTVSITHLPQIAKMAQRHFSVRKATEKRRTVTRVQHLEGEARAEELAKLMGGESISEVTLQHARELLEQV